MRFSQNDVVLTFSRLHTLRPPPIRFLNGLIHSTKDRVAHISSYPFSSRPQPLPPRPGGSSIWPEYRTFYDVPPSHTYPLPLSATLDERLDAWRNAPGRGWEPADFVAWNLQTCDKVIPNHNKLSFPFMSSHNVLTSLSTLTLYRPLSVADAGISSPKPHSFGPS